MQHLMAAINFLNQNSGAIIAVATAILCVVTFYYASITRKILDSKFLPHVTVQAIPDDRHPLLINIKIKNFGEGLATNISFKIDGDLPPHYSEKTSDGRELLCMSSGPLFDGIEALSPNSEITYFWERANILNQLIGEKRLAITCRYKAANGQQLSTKCPIDVRSYMLEGVQEPASERISKSLEAISTQLKKNTSK